MSVTLYLQNASTARASLGYFQKALSIKEQLRTKGDSDIFLLYDIGETTTHFGAAYEKIVAGEKKRRSQTDNLG